MAKVLKMCFQTMDFIACVCDVWILEHIHAFQMSPLDLRSHFLHIVNKDHKAISVGARVHIEDLKAKNSHQTSSDTMHSLPVVCLLPGAKGPVHLAYCKYLAQAERNCFLNSFDFGESFIRPLIKSFDGSRGCVFMAIHNIIQTRGGKVFNSLLHWNTLQQTTPPSPNGHGWIPHNKTSLSILLTSRLNKIRATNIWSCLLRNIFPDGELICHILDSV